MIKWIFLAIVGIVLFLVMAGAFPAELSAQEKKMQREANCEHFIKSLRQGIEERDAHKISLAGSHIETYCSSR